MASIADALEHIKDNPLHHLDRPTIERICHECQYQWRQRELDPATTLALFCQQVARGNLSCEELIR